VMQPRGAAPLCLLEGSLRCLDGNGADGFGSRQGSVHCLSHGLVHGPLQGVVRQ
jgi:hypothetical protein